MATSETSPHDAHGKVINVWYRLSLIRDALLTQACRISPFGQLHCDISIFRIGPISRVHHNGKSTEAPGISRSQGWHCRNALTCCVLVFPSRQLCSPPIVASAGKCRDLSVSAFSFIRRHVNAGLHLATLHNNARKRSVVNIT